MGARISAGEPLRVIVLRSGGKWVARVPSIEGCEAVASTRERCLNDLLDCARRSLGSDVALVEEDPPALAGVSEVAGMLGWDKRKVAVYAERGLLPSPVAELAGGRVWRRADIETFKRAKRREARRREALSVVPDKRGVGT